MGLIPTGLVSFEEEMKIHMQSEGRMKTQGEVTHLQAEERRNSPCPPRHLRFLASATGEKYISIYCLIPLVCGTLLGQPWETTHPHNTSVLQRRKLRLRH